MGKYNFDALVDRNNTSCLKYDFGMQRKGRTDLLPMWVADMDFALPEEILADFHKRIDHGIFGYTDPDAEYYAALDRWFSNSSWLPYQTGMGNGRMRRCLWPCNGRQSFHGTG